MLVSIFIFLSLYTYRRIIVIFIYLFFFIWVHYFWGNVPCYIIWYLTIIQRVKMSFLYLVVQCLHNIVIPFISLSACSKLPHYFKNSHFYFSELKSASVSLRMYRWEIIYSYAKYLHNIKDSSLSIWTILIKSVASL